MKLLIGETKVSETGIEQLTLTTHRVRYDRREIGASRMISITLDAISSCGVVSKRHLILLLLAVIAGGAGVFLLTQGADDSYATYGLFLACGVLILIYFLTRAVALAISSSGQSILIVVKGVKPDALVATVDEIEKAKLNYLGKAVE